MGSTARQENLAPNPLPFHPTNGDQAALGFTSRGRQESMQSLPSFIVVGPPRTGTSWLHDILSKHALLPNPTKETRFFDTHFHRGLDWYRAHFPKSPGNLPMGEVAPTYFASNEARERLANTIPDAKIVCIFRNPVDRILSLYRLKRAYGMIPWTFEEALIKDPELMESSRYVTNFRAWRDTFGPDKVLATVYDDLRDHPQTFLDRVVDFIDIPRFKLSPSQIDHVHGSESMTHPRNYYRTRGATVMAEWFKARRLDKVVVAVKKSPLIKLFLGGGPAFAALSRDVSHNLYEHFLPEVEELESLLHRDLSTWKANVNDAMAVQRT